MSWNIANMIGLVFYRAMLRRARYCHDKLSVRPSVFNVEVSWSYRLQESCAVAKMTARCAIYMGALNFRDALTTPMATIPNIFHGLLFRSTLWMFLQNWNSVALPVPEIIIAGTQNIWAVPGYAHAPFSPKILMGFYSDWPCKCTRQI